MREAGIYEGKKGQELISLLQDEPFRMVSQLGLLGNGTVDCHEYFGPRLILVRPDQNAQPEMVRPDRN